MLTASSPLAWSACGSLVGLTVTCNSPALALAPSFGSFTNGLTLNVGTNGSLGSTLGLLGSAVNLNGTGTTLNNAGTIDPSLLGLLSLASSGAVITSSVGSAVTINNQTTGVMKGTSGLLGANVTALANLNGMALNVQNGVSGVTTLRNDGVISSTPLLGVSILPANIPLVALYGGAQNVVTNSATGVINGRVGLQGSAAGNTFLNAGIINGSVSMGTGAGNNLFTAVTGSQVNGSPGLSLDVLGVASLNLGFAATGVVDGGGGTSDSLILQNSATGTGSGTALTGAASANTYRNFENLVLNSGTWTLDGALVSGQTTLNGGIAVFDNSANFGAASNPLIVNAGGLQAASNGLTLNQNVSLNGNVTVSGANSMTLGGVVYGLGGITKNDVGTLTLAAANTYSGTTILNGGGLWLGTAQSLGNSTLKVGGAATLDSAAAAIGNNIVLNNTLTLPGSGSNFALSGVISGTGSLVKNGAGNLQLNGLNSFSGGTSLSAGTLVVGNDNALGSGVLNVTGIASIDSQSTVNLANTLQLNANLNVLGSAALRFNNVISGTGMLIKSGASDLRLSAANTFSGGTLINGGSLTLGNSAALGTGVLIVDGAAALDTTATLAVSNNVQLNDTLSVLGSNDLTLNGTLTGSVGSVLKNGLANLTLNGNNTYSGGTTLNAGSLTLGSATALGSGVLTVNNSAALLTNQALNLSNALTLNGALSLPSNFALGLNGALSGSGSLSKTGTGTLTLSHANTFSGGTTLSAGTLALTDNAALGSGALLVNGAANLVNAQSLTLANQVQLGAQLTVGGSSDLALNGVLSGNGNLSKIGSGNLLLNAANSFTGGTTLNAGVLTLGNGAGLGTGSLSVTGAAQLAVNQDATLQNAVALGAALTLNTANQVALNGVISGAGSLIVPSSGTVTLNGLNTFTGGSTLGVNGATGGTLIVGSNQALGTGTLTVSGNTRLDANQAVTLGNALTLDNATLTVLGTQNLTLNGSIASNGTGSLIKNGTSSLILTGINTFNGGIQLNSGVLQGSDASLQGAINDNASLVFDQVASGNFSSIISGSGAVSKTGSGSLLLSGNNTFSGGLNILNGQLEISGGQTLSDNLQVNLANNAGAALLVDSSETIGSLVGGGSTGGAVNVANGATLTVGADNLSTTYGGWLQGAGTLAKIGAGSLVLTGASTHSGEVDVDGGTVQVTGSLASNLVNVNNGGTLSGTGSLAGAVQVNVGGHLAVSSGQTLTLGSLSLNQNANLDVALGAAPSDLRSLVAVSGDLNLNGTLNVRNVGGMGPGVYRLFSYGGVLSGAGLTLGLLPSGYLSGDLSVQTAINAQVNLIVDNSNSPLQFWNGAQQVANSVIGGGAGNWVQGASNWTNANGSLTQVWNNAIGVFAGIPGAVNVIGTQTVGGLQFITDGYVLQPGTAGDIDLQGSGSTVLRVDPLSTATINTTISGSSPLEKRDYGTLILGGANTYTGGTWFDEGVLQASADNNLGASSGGLTFNGGTLRIMGDAWQGTDRSILLNGLGGTLDVASATNVFALSQPITGAGALVKAGAGTLALNASNTYSGGTQLNAGRLLVGSDGALGSGALTVNGNANLAASQAVNLGNAITLSNGVGLTVDGNAPLVLSGVVSGTNGQLLKAGSGSLELDGANTYSGGTYLSGGNLILGNAAALGTGSLTVNGAANIDSTGAMAVANNVQLNAQLGVLGSQALSFNGVIGGSAGLDINGLSSLTLNGINTYSGATNLNGGSLILGSDAALGSSHLNVNGNATLQANAERHVANAVSLLNGAALTLSATQPLHLNGSVDGNGSLVMNGSGVLQLSHANSYSGGTSLGNGTLLLSDNAALGSGALAVTGAATLDTDKALSVTNDVGLSATLALTGSHDVTLGGVISGNGALNKQGTASLTLAGANTYSGDTTLAAGTLVLANNAALGTGTLLAGTANLDANGPLTVANQVNIGGALTYLGSNDLTLAGVVSGSGTLVKNGGANLLLTANNTYSGGTQLNAGQLTLSNAQALGSGVLTVNGAGSLDTTSVLQLNSAIQLNGGLSLVGSNDLELAGNISGSGDLSKNGSNTLTLQAANTYSGVTHLNAGILAVGNNLALGSSRLDVNGATTLVSTDSSVGELDNAIRLNQQLTVDNADALTLGGLIDGNAGLLKIDSGILTLSHANTFSGGLTLSTGGVVVGDDAALGSGTLAVTGNASLDASQTHTLSNAIAVDGGVNLSVLGSHALTLNGVISGAGSLEKSGATLLTLNGANSFSGGTTLDSGALTLGNNLALGNGSLIIAGSSQLDANQGLSVANALTLNAQLEVLGSHDLTLQGPIDGSGLLRKTGNAVLTLAGTNSNSGGIDVLGGTLRGTAASLHGPITVASASTLEFAQSVDGTFDGTLTGSGTLLKSAAGTLTLANGNYDAGSASNSFTGSVNIQGGALQTADDFTLGHGNAVNIGAGSLLIGGQEQIGQLSGYGELAINSAGSLDLGGSASSVFAGQISGSGDLHKIGSGQLSLTGDSTHSGALAVDAGILRVDGTIASNVVDVNSGGTLSGNGTLSGDVNVNGGGTLQASTGNSLLALGSLNLANGANFNVSLGGANSGASMLNIAGNVTLDDANLRITDAGGFGYGVYHLIDYQGALTANPSFEFTLVPNGFSTADLGLVTSVSGQINLLVGASAIRYWNGSTVSGSALNGGSGTWTTGDTNWLSADTPPANSAWNNQFAVFAGTAGNVAVQGTQAFTGLQFTTDGYVLNGSGSLLAVAGPGASTPVVRVDGGDTATIANAIGGVAGLNKLDGGTLILSGANTYAGGTTFTGGVVQVASEANLGDSSGALTFNGGTLRITGTGYTDTSRAIVLASGGGTFDIADASHTFDLNQSIAGAGSLGKTGAGELDLDGVNTYTGGTYLYAGTLKVANTQALGSGALNVLGNAALDSDAALTLSNAVNLQQQLTVNGSNPLELDGVVSGSGSLIKNGASTLHLHGLNTYSGGTSLNAGSLIVDNGTSLGSGALIANDGTTLQAGNDLVLNNSIVLNGALTLAGNHNLTLGGAVTGGGTMSGIGSLIKTGNGVLALNGDDSYTGGTQLISGTLLIGNDSALGSGALLTSNQTHLDTDTTLDSDIRLNNALQVQGGLVIDGTHDLTLAGTVSDVGGGAGNLIKNGSGELVLEGANTYTGGTTLASGSVLVGNDAALGTGTLLVSGASRLGNIRLANIHNNIVLNANLVADSASPLTLSGNIGGTGGLTLTGNDNLTLTGNNTYTGGTAINGGAVTVGSNTALGASSGNVNVTGPTTLDALPNGGPGIVLGNQFVLGDDLTVAGSNDLTLNGNLSGNGALIKNGAATLALTGTGSYNGGTQLNAGTLRVNVLSVHGRIATVAGSTLEFAQPTDGTYSSVISGTGAVVKTGAGNLTLTGANTYNGGTTIAAGTLTGSTLSLPGNITIDGGATLAFIQPTDGTFTGQLSGAGNIDKNAAGNLTLTGDNSGFTGTTNVNSGVLMVNGTLGASTINVAATASIGGSGTVAGHVNLANNARLVAGTYLTPLSFNTLALSDQSQLDFSLGQPSAPVTLVSVAGDLTLDGTLNLSNAGGMGTGVYRLFAYGGQLINSGLTYGTLPVDFAANQLTLQARAGTGQVNLLVQTTPGAIQYWNGGDGSTLPPLGTIGGGAGTWGTGTPNWTDSEGQQEQNWNGQFAVFDNVGGVIGVQGTQAVTGLQFLGNGYSLTDAGSGQLNLMAGTNGEQTRVLVNSGNTAQIDVPLTGAGGLNKLEGGTLILQNSNTYTGGTTVSGGVLQVSADDQLGNAAGSVMLNGGELRVTGTAYQGTSRAFSLGNLGGGIDIADIANTFTLNQSLSGDGILIKDGAGTLQLGGSNTYTGGTQVNAGTLSGDSTSLQGNIVTASATTVTFNQNANGQFSGALSGDGQLVKNGAGTLTLSGDNTYTGGTALNAGSLVGTNTNLQGVILSSAGTSLVFDQTGDGIFTGTYQGAGALVKNGTGSLTLTAGNNYSGGTQVNGGRLVGDTGSLQGAIQNAATVVFDQNTAGQFIGDLSGAGTVIKQGVGALLIDSTQHSTGDTIVTGGTLVVGANDGSTVNYGGNLIVQQGGTLLSGGTLGNVNNSGTLAPVTPAGTVNVAGNYTQTSTGTTNAYYNGAAHSVVRVNGTATLGGTLAVTSGAYNGDTTYTLLSASQGISNAYNTISLPGSSPFLNVAVNYTPTAVNLSVSRNDTALASVAQSPNQRATANAVATLPNGQLKNAVFGLSAEQARAAFDSLSGELHASTTSALLGESAQVATALNNRMRQSCSSDSQDDSRTLLAPDGYAQSRQQNCSEQMTSWAYALGGPEQALDNSAWGQTLGSWGKLDSTSNSASVDRKTSGVMFGFDRQYDPHWRVGLAGGYTDSDVDVNDRSSSSKIHSYQLATYAAYREEAFNARFGVSHSMHNIKSSRNAVFNDFSNHLKADYDATTTQVFSELSYVVNVHSVALEPFAGLSYAYFDSDSFKEKGGEAALQSKGQSQNSTQSTMGLRAAKRLRFNKDTDLIVRGSLGWQHVFGTTEPSDKVDFAEGSSQFTTKGGAQSKNSTLAGVGVDLALGERSRLSANYSGQFAVGSRDHAVSLTYSYQF